MEERRLIRNLHADELMELIKSAIEDSEATKLTVTQQDDGNYRVFYKFLKPD